MPKRSSKPPKDENQAAYEAVRALTGDEPAEEGKNPAAVYLGRLGGKKGGPARAEKLSAARKKAIARKAAKARWSRRPA